VVALSERSGRQGRSFATPQTTQRMLGVTSPLEVAGWFVALLCFMGTTWFASWRLPALLVAGNRFS
jgi:hypothetical protein